MRLDYNVYDDGKQVELTEGTGFFSLFDDAAEKLFLEKWSDILNDHLKNRINLVKLRVKRSGGRNNIYGNDHLTNFRIWSSEVWMYETEPKLIFKLSAVSLDEKNLTVKKPYTEIDLNILLDDLVTVDKTTGAVRPKSRIAASKNYDLKNKWDYTSIAFTRWTSKPFRDLLTQLVEEQKELKQLTDGRTTQVKNAKELAQFSQEEILLAKDWFLKNIDSIEFLIPSGSPVCIPNYREFFSDKYDVEKWDFEELIAKIEEGFEKYQQAFFNLYKLNMKPDLDKKGRETIGTNISIKWRRPETDEVKQINQRKYENRLEHYLEQWHNSCIITFKTSLDTAPAVVQSLISKLKGKEEVLSKNAISSLSIATLIIINLFDGNLNFLDDKAAEINPLNLDFPEVA